MVENAYTSPAELRNSIEQVSEIETDDYTGDRLIPVGVYVSQSRKLLAAEKRDKDGKKFISVEVSFPDGIQNDSGTSFGGGQYPLRTWINNKTYQREGVAGGTSSIAEYFRSVGFDPKQLKTNEDFFDALEESAVRPSKVVIGWTNKTQKLDDGTYTKEFAKTRDFNTGTKEDPSYVPFFIKEGERVEARHKVQGFKAV